MTLPAGSRLANVEPALGAAWHPVATAEECDAGPLRVLLLGEAWTITRTGDGLEGRAGERRAHGARVRHGLVWLAPCPPRAPMLAMPEFDDPRFAAGPWLTRRAVGGAGFLLDNFLDLGHLPFVHQATIGAREDPVVGPVDIAAAGGGFVVASQHAFPNWEDPEVVAGRRPLIQHRRVTYIYVPPCSIHLRIDYVEAGGTNVIVFLVQPADRDHCVLWTRVIRDDLGGDPARLADAVEFERAVLEEDLVIQERYLERDLPLDLTTEVHTVADRPTIELRRALAAFVEA